MLHQSNRLSKTKDVQITMMRGRSFFSPHFVIKQRKSAGNAVRATVIVSTKVSKNAVARNRIKRILREVLRLKMLPVAAMGDYAIIVKPVAASLPAAELRASVLTLLRSSRIIE